MSNFQDPHPPCSSASESFQSLWPWTSNFKGNLPHPTLCNKVQNNNCTMHVNERNQNKNETKSRRHIQIDNAFYCYIYFTNNAIVSLNVGFTVWHTHTHTHIHTHTHTHTQIDRYIHPLQTWLPVRDFA